MADPLQRLLASRPYLLTDGAMGTSLFALGLANGAPGELWNLDRPEKIEAVHLAFLEAGSDILLTNSFGGNRCRLAFHDAADRVAPINHAAAKIARQLADRSDREVIVAGSMGPTGEVLEPHGGFAISAAEAAFTEQAAALKAGGADLAWIETMFSSEETGAAARAAIAVGLPYVITMTFDSAGRTMMGISPDAALRMTRAEGWKPSAFGANCGIGPAQLLDSVLGLASAASEDDVIVAKGNCGTPSLGPDMQPHYDGTPEIMADYACFARDAGARVIGGCCGTTAGHIAAMADALKTRAKSEAPDHRMSEARFGKITDTRETPTSKRPARRRRRSA